MRTKWGTLEFPILDIFNRHIAVQDRSTPRRALLPQLLSTVGRQPPVLLGLPQLQRAALLRAYLSQGSPHLMTDCQLISIQSSRALMFFQLLLLPYLRSLLFLPLILIPNHALPSKFWLMIFFGEGNLQQGLIHISLSVFSQAGETKPSWLSHCLLSALSSVTAPVRFFKLISLPNSPALSFPIPNTLTPTHPSPPPP